MWKPIEDAPKDTDIILRMDHPNFKYPLIVVGDICHCFGKDQIFWNGPYDETVSLYKKEYKIEFEPQLFMEI